MNNFFALKVYRLFVSIGRHKKEWFILPLFFVYVQTSVGQFFTVPLPPPTTNQARLTATQSLNLPFWDDFSSGKLNPQLWQNTGGTSINNTMTLTAPTQFVATFDGLKADGKPYDFSNALAQGATDTLLSQVIDLAQYAPSDSLYLSFFWQNRSLGDTPETTDSLCVQFYTSGGIWQTVWRVQGNTAAVNFQQAFVRVQAKNLYLHRNFQFRIVAFGRQSGLFDVWHIDYVYLAAQRSQANAFYQDLALRQNLSPLLRSYRAMPLRQILANPSKTLADSIKTDVTNLFNNNNFFDYHFTITDLRKKTLLQQAFVQAKAIAATTSNAIAASTLAHPLSIANQLTGDSTRLEVKVALVTNDEQRLKQNDTLKSVVVLSDYYAYDDGTAEAGAYLGKGFGRVAVQFINQKSDVVSGVRLHLLPAVSNIEGNPISIQVMSNAQGKPDKVLRSLYTKINYASIKDGFVEYTFAPVAVSDTFYVGYLQYTDYDPVVIGLDKDSPASVNKCFYTLSTTWENLASVQNNATFKAATGSLMIRPVMGGTVTEVILGNENPTDNEALVVYPNPTTGMIYWNNSLLKSVEISDMLGQTLLKTTVAQPELDLQNFNSGIYLLKLSDEHHTFVRKIKVIK